MSEELVTRIGRLRIEHELDTPEKEKRSDAREQFDIVDAALLVRANMAGRPDVEQRAALREVQPGVTITAEGARTTRLSRDEKLAKMKEWAEGLTPEARAEYLAGDKFAAKSERAQQVISEAFESIDGTFDEPGDEVDWNLQALDQEAPYVLTVDEEEDTEEENQQFAPLPWERRDQNGNLYLDEDEDV
jgi:hypothetical protein